MYRQYLVFSLGIHLKSLILLIFYNSYIYYRVLGQNFLPHDQPALQHAPCATKQVLPFLLWRKLDGGRFKRWKRLSDLPFCDDHDLRAIGVLVPVEIQPDRDSLLHHDHIRVITAFHPNGNFLKPAFIRKIPFPPSFRKQKIPVNQENEDQASGSHQQFLHLYLSSRFPNSIRRSLRELETTETELKAMAAEASIGSRSIPKKGYRTPAATGIPAVL